MLFEHKQCLTMMLIWSYLFRIYRYDWWLVDVARTGKNVFSSRKSNLESRTRTSIRIYLRISSGRDLHSLQWKMCLYYFFWRKKRILMFNQTKKENPPRNLTFNNGKIEFHLAKHYEIEIAEMSRVSGSMRRQHWKYLFIKCKLCLLRKALETYFANDNSER